LDLKNDNDLNIKSSESSAISDFSNYFSHITTGQVSLLVLAITTAAYNRIPERLLKAHGRWKSDIAKDGYIKENMRNRLFLKI
jgi:hypothetical protein